MNDILIDAFRHSAWATRTLLDACRGLSAEQCAERPAHGYGSIHATFNHLVRSDAAYAALLGAGRPAWAVDGSDAADLDGIGSRAGEAERAWQLVLAGLLDAERMLVLEDGAYEVHAGVIVAQALQHASAHREQIRARLRDFGVKPPDLQPWAYADATGRGRWREATHGKEG
jgi:uncharacterized damage-inducible protein DinB